jgi:hypothetical protein
MEGWGFEKGNVRNLDDHCYDRRRMERLRSG